jgi:hypothetical protein
VLVPFAENILTVSTAPEKLSTSSGSFLSSGNRLVGTTILSSPSYDAIW